MNATILELVLLGLLSAVLCNLAFVADEVLATVIFGYLTCASVLLLVAVWKRGADAPDP